MNDRDLADFLRNRRRALRPEEAGLHSGTRRRRTPGLRREEVAWLAGISTDYYERLEQARASSPSPQVLTSLGRALRLSEAERLHLSRLAGQAPASFGGPDEEEVPDGVLRLLEGGWDRSPPTCSTPGTTSRALSAFLRRRSSSPASSGWCAATPGQFAVDLARSYLGAPSGTRGRAQAWVMPEEELMLYKLVLGREVDLLDVEQIANRRSVGG